MGGGKLLIRQGHKYRTMATARNLNETVYHISYTHSLHFILCCGLILGDFIHIRQDYVSCAAAIVGLCEYNNRGFVLVRGP